MYQTIGKFYVVLYVMPMYNWFFNSETYTTKLKIGTLALALPFKLVFVFFEYK